MPKLLKPVDFYGIPLTYYSEDIQAPQQSQAKAAAKNLSLDVDSAAIKPDRSQLPTYLPKLIQFGG